MTDFHLVEASSNTQVDINFESTAAQCLAAKGVVVRPRFSVPVGVGLLKKPHMFDFGSEDPPVLVECKSHRWTAGDNAPSAKLTVWNEAMYYFAIAPSGFRRIFLVLRNFSERCRLTLAEYYLHRYSHLVPDGVEFWELDDTTGTCHVVTGGL